MKAKELLDSYKDTDRGRYGKAIERLLHSDIVKRKGMEYKVTPNSTGGWDIIIYTTYENGKKKSIRIEVKTGEGVLSYKTATPTWDEIFPNVDMVLYWAEPNDEDHLEDNVRAIPRDHFIELLKGYELKNGRIVPMIRPHYTLNECNIQNFKGSARRYDYWIGSLNLYPTYRTWKEGIGR